MADTSFLCIVGSRSFKDTGIGQVGGPEAGIMQDSELPQYYFNDFGIYSPHFLTANDFSGRGFAGYMSGKPSTDHFQPGLVQNTTFGVEHQPYPFQNLMDSEYVRGSCFVPAATIILTTASGIGAFDAQNPQFNAGSFSDELGGLFHSTSQLAAERGLCMNTPTNDSSSPATSLSQLSFTSNLPLNYPPMLDNSSSPSISRSSENDDDDPRNGTIRFYNPPDSYPLVAHQQNRFSTEDPDQSFYSIDGYMPSKADCLTPLEMPDGSTRLTANWLPVDPEGGFTIAHPDMTDEGLSGGAIFDAEPPLYGEDAFFNADFALGV